MGSPLQLWGSGSASTTNLPVVDLPHGAGGLQVPQQRRGVAVTQSPEVDGPHRLPHGEQERCAVEGRRIDGSGVCTVVAIRDPTRHGWVLYPHGVAGLGVLIADDAARALAGRISGPP